MVGVAGTIEENAHDNPPLTPMLTLIPISLGITQPKCPFLDGWSLFEDEVIGLAEHKAVPLA
jgi:hypothetical protein